jgi:hypothetical protein
MRIWRGSDVRAILHEMVGREHFRSRIHALSRNDEPACRFAMRDAAKETESGPGVSLFLSRPPASPAARQPPGFCVCSSLRGVCGCAPGRLRPPEGHRRVRALRLTGVGQIRLAARARDQHLRVDLRCARGAQYIRQRPEASAGLGPARCRCRSTNVPYRGRHGASIPRPRRTRARGPLRGRADPSPRYRGGSPRRRAK